MDFTLGDGDEGRQGFRWPHGKVDGLNLMAVLLLTWLVRSGRGITTHTILGHTLRICFVDDSALGDASVLFYIEMRLVWGLLCVLKARTSSIKQLFFVRVGYLMKQMDGMLFGSS